MLIIVKNKVIFVPGLGLDKSIIIDLKLIVREVIMKSALSKIRVSSFFLSALAVIALFLMATGNVSAYGENADWTKAPGCGNPAPAKPWLYSAKSAGAGAVDLFWAEVSGASSWTLAYGVKSGVYPYGIDRFGNNASRSIRVSSLPAGTYYFVIRANNGCMPGPFSNEWKVAVGGGAVVTTGILRTTPTPTPQESKPTISKPGGTKITPTPTKRPGITTPGVTKQPTVSPTPTPTQKGFLQSIIDFFRGLFK